MKLKGVKAIAWDLDGTLLDSVEVLIQVLTEIAAERGHTMPDRATVLLNYHGSLEDSIQNILGLESLEELREVINSFLIKQEDHYLGDLNSILFKDAMLLARQAAEKEITQMLITNRAHKNRGSASPRSIIANSVLAGYIGEIRTGDEVSYNKPDKRSILDWVETNNINPDNLLVIGDQIVDAQLAVNLGARAVIVERYHKIPQISESPEEYGKSIYLVDGLAGIELV